MKNCLLAAVFSLFIQQIVMAQPLLTNVPNRNTVSLNGPWHYIIDPYETGYANFHAEVYDQKNPQSTAAYYNNYHAKDKQELVEYDFDKSPVMNIPGDWNTQDNKLFYYEGTVWFRKTFNYKLQDKRKLFVYFGAVNYKADVYLNGSKLGRHEGGFTPFYFDITSIVKPTGNYLVVKVDNKRTKDGVPALNTDWWNYGGITRDVLLVDEPEMFIQDYTLQLQKGPDDQFTASVQLVNAPEKTEVSISIPELKVFTTSFTDAKGRAEFSFSSTGRRGSLIRWTPESPKLYTVLIITPAQVLKDQVGFKTIEASGQDILLNGKPVYLRGISIHEDLKGRRANSKADAILLLKWAKELGCNYVRLAHYPHNENMVRMADSLGLMVWEEVPVYWSIDFNNPATFENVKDQLITVISRDKNRACTIIWSVANETPLSKGRNEFLQSLVSLTRVMDSTRLVSAALLTRSDNGVNIVDDKIGEQLDIIAFNEYRGWYGGDLATAPDAKWTTPYNKPMVVSEFGGDARQGLHGSKEERWTEEYQEYLYQQNLKMIDKIPNIRGMSPWILTDFRSPRRVLPGIQDGFNRKGLVSDKGVKKKAFFILRDFYGKKSLLYP
ncbi:MAG: beta-glucuronidase [Chitinophagaceae bacterium]|nr:beta-glucuronidase [Chitinophagaceae bacterium]